MISQSIKALAEEASKSDGGDVYAVVQRIRDRAVLLMDAARPCHMAAYDQAMSDRGHLDALERERAEADALVQKVIDGISTAQLAESCEDPWEVLEPTKELLLQLGDS